MFWRKRKQSDFNAEVEAHIALEAERLKEQGLSEEEAQEAARRAFGNVTQVQERFYESNRWRWWVELHQDISYGLRQLSRNPGFAAVAILTLALGIGANTAIFSLVDAVMFRMLPVARPGELFQLCYTDPDSTRDLSTFTNPMWEQVRDHQDIFPDVFAWSNMDKLDLAQGGTEQIANGLWVSGSFFSTLGLHPAAGRLISESDDRRGCPAVAVLDYGFWQDHFGGTKSVIGTTLTLNNRAVEVIGVAPRGFDGMDVGERFGVALPVCAAAIIHRSQSRLDNRSIYWLNVAGRVSPKMSKTQVAAGLRVLSPVAFRAAMPEGSPPEAEQA